MPGPRPKPTAIRVLEGVAGHRPLNDREPTATIITKLPNAPRTLSEQAGRIWREYGNELIRAGLLTALNLHQLYRYAIAADSYEKGRALVDKTGPVLVNSHGGGAFINPAFNIMSMTSKEMHRLEIEFGMTPASATRVKAANPKQLDLFGRLFESDDAGASIYDPPDDEILN